MRHTATIRIEIDLVVGVDPQGTEVHAATAKAEVSDAEGDKVGSTNVSSGGVYLTAYEAALSVARGALGPLLGESDERAIVRLCRRYGFENVVRTAAAHWSREDPGEALTLVEAAPVEVVESEPEPQGLDADCPEDPDGRHLITVPAGGGRKCRRCGTFEPPEG